LWSLRVDTVAQEMGGSIGFRVVYPKTVGGVEKFFNVDAGIGQIVSYCGVLGLIKITTDT